MWKQKTELYADEIKCLKSIVISVSGINMLGFYLASWVISLFV